MSDMARMILTRWNRAKSMGTGDGMKIVENILGHKPRLGKAEFFREFDSERCCDTCRFIRYYGVNNTVWGCLRPNMKPFRVAEKNPRGCVCDGWYPHPLITKKGK